MNFKGQLTLLTSNLKQKWLRTLIASGGIVIGITCIGITTTLSFGVLDTITKAVNSQYFARELNVTETKDGKTDFFNAQRSDFKVKSYDDIQKLKTLDNNISFVYPTFLGVNYTSSIVGVNCKQKFAEVDKILKVLPPDKTAIENAQKEYANNCLQTMSQYVPFERYYAENNKNWKGSKDEPKELETSVVYTKGNKEVLEKLGIKSAQELLNKEFSLSFESIIGIDDITDKKDNRTLVIDPSKDLTKKYKIISVVDKTQDNNNIFDRGGMEIDFWLPYTQYQEVMKEGKGDIKYENIGFNAATAVVKDYSTVEATTENLKSKGYLAASPIFELLKIVTLIVRILGVFLSAFGIIALIVSIFGIVNVIAMSVLERQKEIGILKSLGASNMNIFGLFLGEGAFIGIIGWIIGSILSSLVLIGINFGVNNLYIANNQQAREVLSGINIDSIDLKQPLWLYGLTLAIAIFFTSISAFIPSIGAARKRPVDVLRNE
jgi:ABC-type antimicrobial peptide transport system permease subunit